MANEISGQVTEDGNAVENATVIAALQEQAANLSQSQATEIQALAKLTDANGQYVFQPEELPVGTENYHVVAYKDAGNQRRGQQNFPYVEAQGAIPDSGLLHRYKFNDDSDGSVAIDSAGSANGNIVGASYSTTAKEGSLSLSFDGADDYVDAFGNTSVTDTTINVWANFNSIREQFIHHSSFSSPYSLEMDSGGTWIARWNDGGGYVETQVPVNASSGEWVMLTQTWDTNSGGTFYVNGSEVGAAGTGGNPNQGGNPFRIGANRGGQNWDGYIDDLLYYNRTLSASEVSNLYNLY